MLVLVAAFVRGDLRPFLWLAALIVSFFGPLLREPSGWRLQPTHLVERHSLIVIIALGESLIAVGIGARGTSLSVTVVVAALLGLAVAASFWIAYFDFFTTRMQHLLAERRGTAQIALARDAYSYLHLPMVVGIVLSAFAMREVVAHVGKDLNAVPALALCGGSALYLASYVGLRWRVSRTLRGGRLIVSILLLALFPLALAVPAIVALGMVASCWICLHAYELIWWRGARAETRALRAPAPLS
jgi:low temperature requirement protein LtrA